MQILEDLPDKRVILTRSRHEASPQTAVIFPMLMFCGGVGAAAFAVLFVISCWSEREPDWVLFGWTMTFGGGAALLYLRHQALPVEEQALILEPGRLTVIEERFSRPAFEKVQRNVRVLEVGPDSGVTLTDWNSDHDYPYGFEVWGRDKSLRLSGLKPKSARAAAQAVTEWISQPTSHSSSSVVSDATEVPEADCDAQQVATKVGQSKWVFAEVTSDDIPTLRIQLLPGGPTLSRVSPGLIAGWAIEWIVSVLAVVSGHGILIAFATLLGLALATGSIHRAYELSREQVIMVTSERVTLTTTAFRRRWLRTLKLNESVEVGLLKGRSTGPLVIPSIGIRSSFETIEFGVLLTHTEKQQLVSLLRLFLHLDRSRNLFL